MPMSLSMSSFLLKPHPPFPSQFQFHPHKPIHSLRIHNCTTKTHTQTIQFLKPYLFSQHKTILCGWLCSAVSVYSLSNLLSKFSKIGTVTTLDTLPLVALVVTRLIATYAQHALLWEASLNAVYELRLHVFDRVLQRELAYFEGNDSLSAGDIAYRITAEASDLADTFYTLLNTIVPSTLQLSAMMMQMLVISPALSLISAMIIPCMVLVVALLGQELRKISKEAHISIAALSAYLNEVLPAILFVKANNAESCENARFKRLAMMDYSAKLKKRKMKAVIPQVIQAIYFGILSILCAGSVMISRGSFDRYILVSFVTSLLFLIGPIQDVGKAYNEWRQGEPAAERLFAMTRFKDKVVEKQDAVDLDRVTGELKFCDVSFGYNDDMRLILSGLNLHIRTGEIVAIVGPSGGGKTTLVKLLLRLYDPISGCILIDNHNIQNIRLASLRRHVGVVSQDITLFSGTVAENIGYRDLTTKIDMERVKLVAKTAHADEFIKKLPEGYKTNIGPRGSTLSGGQRQRLAIARAFYQNSSILILDEATSSLDSKSELLVRQAVEHLMQNRTVLVISHRLETVMMAKRVFLLDNGKLKELPRSTMLDGQKDSLLSSGLVI
ncbi:ABC transporter B family member 29, chloroplastic isoform X1 [Abrus precatorius]|uniref:ABC transporter B family member 29, chloroplastic isoform X1 n=1 Tax=Abrus precatorius TaxID=3816 RepID=A0A8B8MAQ2_ABRPR|nr:ABC transporter B family member 29, chloroplastic isoform X1 [Abrus precatorius]